MMTGPVPATAISLLRQRLIDDMSVRRFSRETQRNVTLTMSADGFIRCFLLHILARGFYRIRHYGLLAVSALKASLARARELLAVAAPVQPAEPNPPSHSLPPCPCCAGRMRIIETSNCG